MIKCENVNKKFGDFSALTDVSINVEKGKIFGLLGPNGAGKTTLIRIINQITMPDSGKVYFDGRLIDSNDVYNVGYLPEERGLYKKMKVGEQSMYLARLKGMKSAQAERELKQWFVKFGIETWWNKKVEELSKGMAQKVQFITTILHKPSLLILDEPFSGFDPVNAQLIRNEILKLKANGTTIMLSTHNMESVEELCDDIALINKSKLVVSGSVEDILRNHGDNSVEIVYGGDQLVFPESNIYSLKSDDLVKGKRVAVFNVNDEINAKDILTSILEVAPNIISYRELIPSMNDIFIKLVSKEG